MDVKLPVVVDSVPESLTEEVEVEEEEEQRVRPQHVKDRIKNYKNTVKKRRTKNKLARKARRANKLRSK
jgi:hypothetical protein